MFCEFCGSELENGAKFCSECGAKVPEAAPAVAAAAVASAIPEPQVQPEVQKPYEPAASYSQPQQYNAQPDSYSQPRQYAAQPSSDQGSGVAMRSMIFGIASLAVYVITFIPGISYLTPVAGIVFAILALIGSAKATKLGATGGKVKAARITGIIGIIVGAIAMIVDIIVIFVNIVEYMF